MKLAAKKLQAADGQPVDPAKAANGARAARVFDGASAASTISMTHRQRVPFAKRRHLLGVA